MTSLPYNYEMVIIRMMARDINNRAFLLRRAKQSGAVIDDPGNWLSTNVRRTLHVLTCGHRSYRRLLLDLLKVEVAAERDKGRAAA